MSVTRFYVGCHHPSDAQHFPLAMVSIRALRRRRTINPNGWMLDSGAFTEITLNGGYTMSVAEHARDAERWLDSGDLHAVVAQDYMCEPFALAKTGLTVADHQRLTIDRYDALRVELDPAAYILPVIQGYRPDEYAAHVDAYADRLALGAWVGVGSVCKLNANPAAIVNVLAAIHDRRPDLRLHGFGIKLTALESPAVRHHLHSADSAAWSRAARWTGRDRNDWREAQRYVDRVDRLPTHSQPPLPFGAAA